MTVCVGCERTFHGGCKVCPECGIPNPNKGAPAAQNGVLEGEIEGVRAAKASPGAGGAQPSNKALSGPPQAPGVPADILDDDEAFCLKMKQLEAAREEEEELRVHLTREKELKELQIELAGMQVSNNKTISEIREGSLVFDGVMHSFTQHAENQRQAAFDYQQSSRTEVDGGFKQRQMDQ